MLRYCCKSIVMQRIWLSWQEKLEQAKNKVKKDIESIEAECTSIKATMSDLKTQLYAKFGNSINLEAEED